MSACERCGTTENVAAYDDTFEDEHYLCDKDADAFLRVFAMSSSPDEETTITRAEPSDAGCWIDDRWGQYGVARMISLANDYGYADAEVVDIAHRHLACIMPSDAPNITGDEWEIMHDAADEVDAWMNENVAPEGLSFGWYDGEFFLWANDEWEEVY